MLNLLSRVPGSLFCLPPATSFPFPGEAAVCRTLSSMISMYKQLSGAGKPASHSGRSSSVRVLAASRTTSPSSMGPQDPAYSTRASSKATASRPKSILHVPGIGKSYERMLRQQGIQTVEQLSGNIIKELHDGAPGNLTATPAVKYLQGLGIRRQDHAQKIIRHITATYAPELHSQLQAASGSSSSGSNSPPQDRRPDITFCVEGNISAGKSTFLGYITNNNEQLQHELGVVHEPVDQWQSVPTVEGGTLNLLDRFYSDPQKYAYTFQNYVFMSRVMQEKKSAGIKQPVRLMERSVFSDRMVFVRAVRESGWMGDVELAVYDSWFGPILESNPWLRPDGFIYLKCDPSTCMERLKMRGRHEEDSISMSYLEGLHAKHEDWLGAGQRAHPISSSSSGDTFGQMGQRQYARTPSGLLVPPELRDSLYYLNKNGPKAPRDMHDSLHDVPALVLDCNADVLRDRDLQQEVQAKVAEYINFVRQRKSHSAAAGSAEGAESGVFVAPSRLHTQPGAPQGVQEQGVAMVTEAARQSNAKVVANSSGELKAGTEAGVAAELLSSSRLSGSSSVNGSLEVLHAASMGGRAV